MRSGLSSTTTTRTGLFTTLDPNAIPTITNFRVTGCEQEVVGLKTFNYFTLSWSSTASGGSFQIGVNTTSSSSGAAVILTVPGTARSGQVGGYLAGTTMHRWFWIRYGSGPWIPLAGNPLATNVCAL